MIKYKKPRGTKDIYGLEMDVMQYVKTGGQNCLLCGYWKVYSNPDQALQVFHLYTECKERFALQIKSGMTIREIVCVA